MPAFRPAGELGVRLQKKKEMDMNNLEEKRLKEEVRLRELEIELERDKLNFEFKHKEKIKFSPLLTTAIAAFCALLGTILGAYINGISSLNLERQKFESNLILKAVETGDQKEAIDNLNFFVKAGFIEDSKNKISNLIKEDMVPVLPRSDGASHSRKIELKISSSRDVYTIGEKIDFQVKANQDCYIRMFYYASDGSSYQLFPNKYSQDNFIKKTQPLPFRLAIVLLPWKPLNRWAQK